MRLCLFIIFLIVTSGMASAQDWSNLVVVDDIQTTGNKITKYHIILRELSVHACDLVPKDSLASLLRQNKQRLINTGLFNEIELRWDTLSKHSYRLNVSVRERWYVWPEVSFQLADRNFNVWWQEMHRDIQRTIIGVNLTHRNFRGNTERLVVGGQIGYAKKVSINYIKPYLDKKQHHGMGFGFSYQQNAETYYKTDSNKLRFARSYSRPMLQTIDGFVSYHLRPGYHTFHMVRAGFKTYLIDDSILHLNNDYIGGRQDKLQFIEVSYRQESNNTDNWIYPLRGSKTIFNSSFFLGLKGFDYQAFATLEHAQYHWLTGKLFASGVFRGRLMIPQAAPYLLRSALGGKYEYVRGYELYVIDGYQYSVFRTNLKWELLNRPNIMRLPFKYLPVFPLKVFPKIFADAGFVTNPHPGNSFLNNRPLYACGVGLDMVTIYDIKLRIEYSINHLGQYGLYIHFASE